MDQTDVDKRPAMTRLERMAHAVGPILSGLFIDLIDLGTFGPVGLYAGFLIGGAAGWYLALSHQLGPRQRWLWALAAGAYCTTPFTEFIPVATLIGAVARYRQTGEDSEP